MLEIETVAPAPAGVGVIPLEAVGTSWSWQAPRSSQVAGALLSLGTLVVMKPRSRR